MQSKPPFRFLSTATSILALAALAACSHQAPRANASAGAAAATPAATPATTLAGTPPPASPCPTGVAPGTRCYSGQDEAGAYYWIAIPAQWNQVLVMHAHGGPETGPPSLDRATEDLQRWSITVKAGYAWAGSTYRRGGYGVTMAAEDTERLRQRFVRFFGEPRRTILHGQSYGGGVASKAAELYRTVDGRKGPYDGLLLTSGVLGGGTQAYDYRLDLRVVYQAVCNNHPLPTEPDYPLWQGLPAGAKLSRAELSRRIDDCTGVRKPEAQRTPQQRERLATLTRVIRIPERSLIANMNWATYLFADIAHERLDGKNAFGNIGVRYTGSRDDAQLNAAVRRYAADPQAVARLAADADPNGRVDIPTLGLHAIDDPTAFVELESAYREIREKAGTANLLVQTFSRENEHSYLSDPEYPALFASLMDWIDRGVKPTPASVASRCSEMEASFGAGCRFDPAYVPGPLSSRVPTRDRTAR